MRTRTPPAALPVRVCSVCGQLLRPRARATPPRCRVCLTKQAQAVVLTVLATPRAGRKRKNAVTPSILHAPRRRDDGAG
jgi:hypothetical protein